MKGEFYHEMSMSLRSSTDCEIGGIYPPLCFFSRLSFPRRRESRLVQRGIGQDTRFRGYDGTQAVFSFLGCVLSKDCTKSTKFMVNNIRTFRVLRALRGEKAFARLPLREKSTAENADGV